MKRAALHFETVLIVITIIFGLLAIVPGEAVFVGAMWLIVLGVLQVLHSLYLGISYWDYKDCRHFFAVYWIASAIDLATLFLAGDNDSQIFTIVVFPLMLASFLWYITFRFRIPKAESKEETSTINTNP